MKQADGSCKKIEDEYKSSTDFITALGGTYVDGSDNCFNSAGFTAPMVALVAACTALLRL